ncbi:MAG: polyphosphate polymerase domain-containing protein [Bacteroidales bacterium]|nr:polyphosphate polymerase domain-containing protein [Bacteroidales bacterium]
MLIDDIESELGKLDPASLDNFSRVKLMNRVEIKYVFSTRKLTDLINLLGKHYFVLEINNRRALPYSTTYLDTSDSLFYNQHVRGEYSRYKIRYRKYETTNESFLEIKKKSNKRRTSKWRIEYNQVPGAFDSRAAGFIEDYLQVSSSLIKPAIINKFSRITLAGYILKERITIDFNISFSGTENQKIISMPYLAVAELKKEAFSDSSPFKDLIKQLNIYPSGFSKYCIGSALLNDSLKKNMLKPKLLLLNKLENEYYGSDVTG